MKTVLVPCDFSESAVEAFVFGQDIAAASGGDVVVLHVIDIPVTYESAFGLPPYAFDVAMMKGIEETVRDRFNKMLEKFGKGSSPVRFVTELGAVAPAVRKVIRSEAVDLVVMGTHGASGAKEFFIGSNAEKVVRTSPVPVLVMRKAVPGSSIRNIVFPTEFDLHKSELIAGVKWLQTFFKARLHLLHVVTPARFKSDYEVKFALNTFAERHALNDFTINYLNDMNEVEGILSFAKEIHADMIAMATHGRRGLAHLVSGSIAEDVVNHVECPIWTYAL